MTAQADGWWTRRRPERPATSTASCSTTPTTPRPDPRSRRQPDGVHGLSRVVRPGRARVDRRRTGPAASSPAASIYELHIGTFTPEGTLDAAIDRLDHLVELGVDFVELLPVNAFNGTHNWGYDGVLWYAVHEALRRPGRLPALRRRLPRARARRHPGRRLQPPRPERQLPARVRPVPARRRSATRGASSINLDEPEVRRYIVDNALMWLRDYHVDGLRLDAVHALVDTSRRAHPRRSSPSEPTRWRRTLGRPLTLIAESDLNDPTLIRAARGATATACTAQWSDDFHHAVHVAADRRDRPATTPTSSRSSALAKVVDRGFFHDGTCSSLPRPRPRPPDRPGAIPTWRLVDVQPGPRPDRQPRRRRPARRQTLDDGGLAIAAVLTLLAPFTPMLFMGEEWAASTPWQFFTSHPEPELGRATAEGRIAEFAAHGLGPRRRARPAGPRDVRALEARLVGAVRRGWRGTPHTRHAASGTGR